MTVTSGGPGIDVDARRAWRHDNVGRLLLTGFGYFESALMRRVHAAGFADIRHVHFNVLRHLDFEGTRIIELAARAGITKGAMGQIVKECERLGLIVLADDPDDGRAKTVMFAKRGLKLMDLLRRGMAEVQAEMTAITGKRDMEAMVRALQSLRDHLAQVEEDVSPRPRVRVHR